MFMLKVRPATLLLCGLATMTLPFAGGDVWLRAAPVFAQAADMSQTALSQWIQSVYSEYQENGDLSAATLQKLHDQADALIPYIQAGILISANRIPLTTAYSQNIYSEWNFWLRVGHEVNKPQLQEPLLRWLTDKRPMPDPFAYARAMRDLLPAGKEDLLKAELAHASYDGTGAILDILSSRNKVTSEQLEAWLKSPVGAAHASQYIGYLANTPDGKARLMQLFDEPSLSAEAKRSIIFQLSGKENVGWLRKVASTTTDPYIEQTIDAQLVWDHGDTAAAKRLYESGMKAGFLQPLFAPVERELIKLYPDGELAKGIKHYSEIKGSPYFFGGDDEAWYTPRGADYAQPEAAIKQWLDFIQAYPKHPAADDAAYRLARCYQMLGKFDQALYWFEQATQIGDRDISYDAVGQFLYMIDVEMTEKDFANMDQSKLPDWQKAWLQYAAAVSTLRRPVSLARKPSRLLWFKSARDACDHAIGGTGHSAMKVTHEVFPRSAQQQRRLPCESTPYSLLACAAVPIRRA